MSHQNTDNKKVTAPIFLNNPIKTEEEDIIGVESYVNKLSTAIDEGARMIAITSSFGSGKSSIVELCEQNRKTNKKWWQVCLSSEKFLKISMWSLLDNAISGKSDDTIALHKSFLYQLAKQINSKKGTYISRRLNSNYGLFKLHINKGRYFGLLLCAVISFMFTGLLHFFKDEPIINNYEFLRSNINLFSFGLIICGIIFCVLLFSKAETLLSFPKKDAADRNIEADEIMDLYQSEILKDRQYLVNIRRKVFGIKRFIVVIEDLDRTSDEEVVVNFLKELRKYYLPDVNNIKLCNQIVFIVNVKRECALKDDSGTKNGLRQDSLYAKLFDYIIGIPEPNIDNFDSILEGILQTKEDELRTFFEVSDQEQLTDIEGISWIIKEPGVGIREIKERLNYALTLYESLVNKFGKSNIRFSKCAVFAYILTAFEEDFQKMDDRMFDQVVNKRLKVRRDLTEEEIDEIMKEYSTEYRKNIRILVNAKLIESDYRTYFYNYPKESYFLTVDESKVFHAIIEDEECDDLEDIAAQLVANESKVTFMALRKVKDLGIKLPNSIFKSKTLFLQALSFDKKAVMEYYEGLDYNESSEDARVAFFQDIIGYGVSKQVSNQRYLEELIEMWTSHFQTTGILKLRKMLCENYPNDILFYRDLFYSPYPIIKTDELDLLAFEKMESLIDFESEDYNVELLEYFLNCFCKQKSQTEKQTKSMLRLLIASKELFECEEISPLFVKYMLSTNTINSALEEEICNLITDNDITEDVRQSTLNQYKDLVNSTVGNWSEATSKRVSSLNEYSGYSCEVAEQLREDGYIIDYVLIRLSLGVSIPFGDKQIRDSIKAKIEYLLENPVNEDLKYFQTLRFSIVQTNENTVREYSFMFEESCPVLTTKELKAAIHLRYSDKLIRDILPAERVEVGHCELLAKSFSRKSSNPTSFLEYIAELSEELARICFDSIDFKNTRYRILTESVRKRAIEKLTNKLGLEDPYKQIHFMKATGCIEHFWLKGIGEEIRNDTQLNREFVTLINQHLITDTETIKTLAKGSYYIMDPLINRKLLEFGCFKHYVVSKIRGEKYFNMETEDKNSDLWKAYISIFSSAGFDKTKTYMLKNKGFLERIIGNQEYLGFSKEIMMQLHSVKQDSNSINHAMSYGVDFAEEFFSSMDGFTDSYALETFLRLVAKEPILAESDDLYEHIYDLLDDRFKKRKYTILHGRK